ncbi:LPXTG cell wall anchor domain-containing protein [Corynebacterium stationis]|uniref:LPXTG cell wall anchor domain-containing protein n=1 Tax=Corynebacterium stationis TaxID=1705 RepID=UPI001471D844|nr:LPXTG cell wall anchor domain-containing protein [Corynebacterium stationis]
MSALLVVLALTFGSQQVAASADTAVVSGYQTLAPSTNTIGDRLNELTISIPHDNDYDDVPPGELPPGGRAGYEVIISQISNIDIRTDEGYRYAKGLDVERARSRGLSEERSIKKTDIEGQAFFGELSPGVYLVEFKSPETPGYRYKTFKPFIVILPLVGKDGQWLNKAEINAKSDGDGEISPPTEFPNPVPSTEVPPPTRTPHEVAPTTEMPREVEVLPREPDRPVNGTPGRLAETGASVLWIVAMGLLALLAGIILIGRKNKNITEDAS